MKFFLLSAIVASTLAAEVQVDFNELVASSKVVYPEVACGEWNQYHCCATKQKCEKLKNGGSDKKTQKKRIRERKAYCVLKSETCCGSDLTYNWKDQRKNGNTETAVDHQHEKKKNVKGCDNDEVCVATDLLKHSKSKDAVGDHDEDAKFAVKQMIGKKSKTNCMKKDKLKKKKEKLNKKYKKKVDKEKKNADTEFEKNVKIMSIQDHGHQCGNFDKKVFKCCSPDENFCEQIGAADKDKWCVNKKDECCMDFTWYGADRDMIKLDYTDGDDDTYAANTACKHHQDKKVCVYDTHDKKEKLVTTKCVDKKTAKKNKKRGGIKKKDEEDGSSILDILGGGGQQTGFGGFPF